MDSGLFDIVRLVAPTQFGRVSEVRPEVGQLIDEATEDMRASLDRLCKPGHYHRSAHASTIGLLKGLFTIEPNLPEHCQVGLFSNANTYPTLIRRAHGSNRMENDKSGGARGFSLKLLGVKGERYGFYNREEETQDFVLSSFPAFFFSGMEAFVSASRLLMEGQLGALVIHLIKERDWTAIWYAIRSYWNYPLCRCLLERPYWSISPYRFGDTWVKYALRPSNPKRKKPMPQRYLPFLASGFYLGESISETLAQEEISFDFCVQFFKDEKTTCLHDGQAMWRLRDAPLVKLATLRLPIQETSTEERDSLVDKLSFSPAHCLKVHEPVGEINMGRVVVYDRLAEYRQQESGLTKSEPTLEQFESL